MSVEPETRASPSSQRWAEIERLLDLALERPADERRAFLERACAGDMALLEEVSRLLRSCERPEAWLDGQAPSYAAPLVDEAEESATTEGDPGRPLSHRGRGGARRDGHGLSRRARRAVPPARRAQAGPRRSLAGRPPGASLRRGAADPRLARAPPHRPAAGRRHHARGAPLVRPGIRGRAPHRPLRRAAPAADRGSAASCSSRCATRCSTPTRTWWSTATSSRATSWSRPAGR